MVQRFQHLLVVTTVEDFYSRDKRPERSEVTCQNTGSGYKYLEAWQAALAG